MTSMHPFVLGLMVAWTPCLIVFAVLLWRAPVVDDTATRKVDVAVRTVPER
jgi:hypothetical protein